MKLRRIVSAVLVFVLMISMFSVAATAANVDIATTSAYHNQNYLETQARAAANTTGLGCTYTKTSTTWKVWSPVATQVMVKLYKTGTDAESGAGVIGTRSMTKDASTGVWSLTLDGDHKNEYYTYLLTINGNIKETQDPYATAVGANGDRSMVVDLDSTDPEGWNNDKHVLFNNPGEAVVWEVHVRDFSISDTSGVSDENKGKYLAFTEGNTTVNGEGNIATCVDYLVEKGVNCVQLMPVADFSGVDETSSAGGRNWGYNPINFNVPEGSYASTPYDGNARIKEFKQLIQALHDRGISVVMDVVYNHTYVLEGSALAKTVPQYYHRMMDSVNYYDGSGLGNCLSTEKAMTRKYVISSLKYWVEEYHVDGFRFDLMGALDVDTLNQARAELDKVDSRILMYGEPWAGGNAGISNGATNGNFSKLNSRIGGFNQPYSTALKGAEDMHTGTTGAFVQGASNDAAIMNAAKGSAPYFGTSSPVSQHINYIDNHDNLALFDKILRTNKYPGFMPGKDDNRLYDRNQKGANATDAKLLSQVRLALTSALTAQGTPFMLAGTEFARSKYGDANSYRSNDNINAINWNRAKDCKTEADYYAGLIKIRNAFGGFTGSKANPISTISGCPVAYTMTNSTSGKWNKIVVAINNSSSAKSIKLPSGSWVVVANGTKAGTKKLADASGSYSVGAMSSAILVDKSSFDSYNQPASGEATLTTEHYVRDSASDSYKKTKTDVAKYTVGQTYRASANTSILFDHELDKWESSTNALSGKATAGQKITVKFYYTRTVGSNYLTVNFLDTKTGNPVRTKMMYHLHNGDPYSIPATLVEGYEIDTTRYPGNTVGVFDSSKGLVFNFYYKELSHTQTVVHFYNSHSNWKGIECYAYYDTSEGQQEPLGPWTNNKAGAMVPDTALGAGWYKVTIPGVKSCRVMFHSTYGIAISGQAQEPGQGEAGYPVSGEAWIKDRVVTFSCSVVTSHIDLVTGKQLAPDEVKNYENVSSSSLYATSANKTIKGYKYITPSNASNFYSAGTTNVVYLYEKDTDDPGPGPGPEPGPDDPLKDKYVYGNINLDEAVDIADATTLQRILARLSRYTDEMAEKAADTNGDGKVDISDATCIQRYLARLSQPNCRVCEKIEGVDHPDDPDPVEGEHTFEELINIYNTLSEKYRSLSEAKFGTDPAYIEASNTLNKYKEVIMNASSATPQEIDEAYEACLSAYEGIKDYSNTSGGGSGGGDTGSVTLYFTNNKHWGSVYAYLWLDGTEGSWPGEMLSSVATNEYNEQIYSVTIDLSSYNRVIFNDGDKGKTEDIVVTQGMQNGIYCNEDMDQNGGYITGRYDYAGVGGGGSGGGGGDLPSGDKVYLIPGVWNEAGAIFAVYFYNSGEDFKWVPMSMSGVDKYSANIPAGYGNMIFVRLNPAGDISWDSKWNQSPDLTVNPGGTYQITGWDTGDWQ